MDETAEAGELVVAIGFSGGRKSKYILNWAMEKFVPQGNVTFKLLHVYPKISSMPSPMGSWVPVSQVREEVVAEYRNEVEWKKKKTLLPYQQSLKTRKIKSDIIMLESDDIAMAITLEVNKQAIQHLVIGVTSTSIFSRKNMMSMRRMMGENLSSLISETAPPFCSVYFISDGKLQHMRPAESEPTVISMEDMSGLSSASTDSSSSTSFLTLGRLLKSRPSSPIGPGSSATKSKALTSQQNQPETLRKNRSIRAVTENIEVKHNTFSDENPVHHAGLSYSKAPSQSSSSSGSWVSDRTSPGDSFTANPPQKRSPALMFAEATSSPNGSFTSPSPVNSFVGTPPSGSFVGTPPSGSFVGTPPSGSFVGTPPSGSFVSTPPGSFVGTPPGGNFHRPPISSVRTPPFSSHGGTPPQQRSPTGSTTGGSPSQQNLELDKLRVELRHLEQMYELAQNSDINEKFQLPLDQLTDLSKQRVEEAIKLQEHYSIEQHGFKAAQTANPDQQNSGERTNFQTKAETSNEDKHKQPLSGIISQYQKFTWQEIVGATSSFSEEFKIGMGAFGTVYKCKLNHTTVAVKVLHTKDSSTNKQFLQELEILSTIRHPHLLLLLGAVPEGSSLVYEYMENGSLDDRLFHKENIPPLPWYDRFRICWEVASALAFLHSTKPRPIIHRDLKPANILLDQNLVSKIGDAGLGTMINVDPTAASLKTIYKETSPVGTLCYIDPEYQRTGRVSTKADVFALGVVIMQLLTAKPAVGIAYLIEDAIDEGNLMEVLDAEAGKWPEIETLELAQLGLQCAELRGRDRPDLREIVLPALERLKEIAEAARELAANGPKAPPEHFICPLGKVIIEEPYVAADGYTYDRKAIEQWFLEHDTSPTTNLPVPHKFIMPNYTLLEAINQWKGQMAQR